MILVEPLYVEALYVVKFVLLSSTNNPRLSPVVGL
jgi:hypothetical protein